MLALVSTGTSPGLPGLIGLLALSGMVVTDANALLSLVEESRREGMDARTAVIEGGRGCVLSSPRPLPRSSPSSP